MASKVDATANRGGLFQLTPSAFDANNNNFCNKKEELYRDENKNIISAYRQEKTDICKPSPHEKFEGHVGIEGDEDFIYFSTDGVKTTDLMNSGGRASVIVNDKEIALVCHDNVVYAVQEKCPHYGGPLHLGDIEDVPGCGPSIKCPWHSWTFNLATGKCIAPHDRNLAGHLETFPVRVDSRRNQIKIGFTEISPSIFRTPPK